MIDEKKKQAKELIRQCLRDIVNAEISKCKSKFADDFPDFFVEKVMNGDTAFTYHPQNEEIIWIPLKDDLPNIKGKTRFDLFWMKCATCEGAGKIGFNGICPECKGQGYL